jgi:hypothetical protein
MTARIIKKNSDVVIIHFSGETVLEIRKQIREAGGLPDDCNVEVFTTNQWEKMTRTYYEPALGNKEKGK